jgi:spore maturation protein CgeB
MKITNKKNKIFYAFPSDKSYMSQWQYYHFIDELKHHNIEFEVFNNNDYNSEKYKEELLRTINKNKDQILFFLTGLPDDKLDSGIIKEIKNSGIPTVLVCWDNLSIPFWFKHNAPLFDLVWLTSFETEKIFRLWGANTIFLPYAANPYKFYPVYENEINSVCFIGTLYGARTYKIKILDKNNISVNIFGGNKFSSNNKNKPNKKEIIKEKLQLILFKEGRKLLKGDLKKAIYKRFSNDSFFSDNVKFYDSVSFEEMNKLYSNYAVSLGISEVWNSFLLKKPLHKLHLRTFEIPMCGGLQVISRIPELENYFNNNEEIIFYDSEEEMIDKINFFLREENYSHRFKIKNAARKRCENEHNWYNRFSQIFKKLNF